MRAFLGIALPPRLRETLVACRMAAIDADPTWRNEKWVAEENLHVTLRFLGDLDDHTTSAVADRIGRALADADPFRLSLDRAAVVPRLRAASLIWAEGGTGAAATTALAAHIDEALFGLVPPPDRRRFRAHATLCRARHPRRLAPPALDAIDHVLHRADERARSMSVADVILYSSVLTPAGPIYERHVTFHLGG